jgi:hypothetical protein
VHEVVEPVDEHEYVHGRAVYGSTRLGAKQESAGADPCRAKSEIPEGVRFAAAAAVAVRYSCGETWAPGAPISPGQARSRNPLPRVPAA